MTEMRGRNIFVTNLSAVLRPIGPALFLERAVSSHFSAIWIRIGRGAAMDDNLQAPELPGLQKALKDAGVDLWGWHVPFCADPAAARKEAGEVLAWVERRGLDGVVLDIERTRESPRFRGGAREAEIYAKLLSERLAADGRGIALSTHDQPSLHGDVPFEILLQHIGDVCPQIYYRSASVSPRFDKCRRDYETLIARPEFKDRFKPTGNISVTDDVPLPDTATCLAAARNFMELTRQVGSSAYSFWCWDTAPTEIWDFFRDTPA